MRFARPVRPILCAGFGVLSPAGPGIEAFLPHAGGGAARRREAPDELEPLGGEPVDRLRRMDRYGAVGYAAARLAVADAGAGAIAGAGSDGADDEGCGVMVGSSIACWSANRRFHHDLAHRPATDWSPALFVRTVANAVNGDISIARRLKGPCETFVSGWTAGAEAIIAAAAAIDAGRARAMLAGGIEAADGWWAEHAATNLPVESAAFAFLEGDRAQPPGGGARRAGGARLVGWHRSHDPEGRFSLAATFDALHPLAVGVVIVVNRVTESLLRRWRSEAADRAVVNLPERVGELGAAGSPVGAAVVDATIRSAGVPGVAGAAGATASLVLSRDPEGGTAALVFQ